MKKILLIAGLIAFGVSDVVVLWLVAGSNHPVTSSADAPIARKKSKIREAPDANVFGIAKVWQLHLEVAGDQYPKLQPAGGMPFFGGPGGAPQAAAKPGEEEVDRHKGGSFGIEFPWVRTDLIAEGTTYKNLGLRYKGGGSYMPSAGKLQRNF